LYGRRSREATTVLVFYKWFGCAVVFVADCIAPEFKQEPI
jgi:hypothetical protein